MTLLFRLNISSLLLQQNGKISLLDCTLIEDNSDFFYYDDDSKHFFKIYLFFYLLYT